VSDNPADSVSALHANPVLAGNVNELCKLQEALPVVVTNVYKSKKKGRRGLVKRSSDKGVLNLNVLPPLGFTADQPGWSLDQHVGCHGQTP